LTGLNNLNYLNLENNRFDECEPFLLPKTSLSSLYLSGNQIHDLTPLAGLTAMQWFEPRCQWHHQPRPAHQSDQDGLAGVAEQLRPKTLPPLAGLTNLYYALDLSANQITNIAPLTNLHAPDLAGAVAEQPDPRCHRSLDLSNVTSLDFSRNPLTNASGVSGMTQITWLSFNQDSFTTAPTLTGTAKPELARSRDNHLTDVSGLAGLNSLNWPLSLQQ